MPRVSNIAALFAVASARIPNGMRAGLLTAFIKGGVVFLLLSLPARNAASAIIPPYISEISSRNNFDKRIMEKAKQLSVPIGKFSAFYTNETLVLFKQINGDYYELERRARENPIETVVFIDKFIKENPNSARAYFLAGVVYEAAGKFGPAMDYYAKGVKLDPQIIDGLALYRKAHLALKLDLYAIARKDYTASLAVVKDNPYALIERAQTYYLEGKLNKSAGDMKSFFLSAFEPAQIEAVSKSALCEILTRKGYKIRQCAPVSGEAPPLSLADYARFEELKQKAVYGISAKLLRNPKKIAQLYAKEAFKESAQTGSYKIPAALSGAELDLAPSADGYIRRAVYRYKDGLFYSALSDAEKAIELDKTGNNGWYYSMAGGLRFIYRDTKKAEEHIKNAIKYDGKNAYFYSQLADLYLLKGDYKSAKLALDKCFARIYLAQDRDDMSKGLQCKRLAFTRHKVRLCKDRDYFSNNPALPPVPKLPPIDINFTK